jgi:alginate O-acetyltransferase complex protein AlgJ
MHKPAKTKRFFPVTGVFFIILLVSLISAAGVSLYFQPDELRISEITYKEIVKGRSTAALENVYEDMYALQKPSVNAWGVIRYGLFREGNEKVVAGENDWLYTAEEFASYPNENEAITRKLQIIFDVQQYLAVHGSELLVALVPAKARIYPEYLGDIPWPQTKQLVYQKVRKKLVDTGILAPDLAKTFALYRKNQQIFLRTDTHWTPAGAELAAHRLALDFAARCEEKKLPRTSFHLVKQSPIQHKGDLMKFTPTEPLQDIVGPKPEMLTPVKSRKKETGTASLFGDAHIPVVLVGTSYSANEAWGFVDHLKVAFKADILNMAEEGKGPMAPMEAFLQSDVLQNNPPELVIWEIPERFFPRPYDDVSFAMLNNKTRSRKQALLCDATAPQKMSRR